MKVSQEGLISFDMLLSQIGLMWSYLYFFPFCQSNVKHFQFSHCYHAWPFFCQLLMDMKSSSSLQPPLCLCACLKAKFYFFLIFLNFKKGFIEYVIFIGITQNDSQKKFFEVCFIHVIPTSKY